MADEVEKFLEQEEMYYSQRRLDWLNFDEKNTPYFQNFASARRAHNRIKKLKDHSGVWCEGTA